MAIINKMNEKNGRTEKGNTALSSEEKTNKLLQILHKMYFIDISSLYLIFKKINTIP